MDCDRVCGRGRSSDYYTRTCRNAFYAICRNQDGRRSSIPYWRGVQQVYGRRDHTRTLEFLHAYVELKAGEGIVHGIGMGVDRVGREIGVLPAIFVHVTPHDQGVDAYERDALLGLVVAGTWGWQNEDWMPAPGEKRPVGHGQPFAIQLESFQPSPQEQSLQSYESRIIWIGEDGSSRTGTVGFGRPARLDGFAVRQVAYAPFVQLNAIDAEGLPLALQASGAEFSTLGAIEIALLAPEERPLVYLPTLDLFLALRFEPWCEAQVPALYVDQLQSGDSGTTAIGSVQERGTLDGDNFRLEVNLTYRPVLRVDSRPGMTLVVGGLVVAIGALAISWLIEPQLAWLVLEPGKEESSSIRLLVPPALRGNRWLSRLIGQLRTELPHDL